MHPKDYFLAKTLVPIKCDKGGWHPVGTEVVAVHGHPGHSVDKSPEDYEAFSVEVPDLNADDGRWCDVEILRADELERIERKSEP